MRHLDVEDGRVVIVVTRILYERQIFLRIVFICLFSKSDTWSEFKVESSIDSEFEK